MRIRYVGADKNGRSVPISGGQFHFPRNKWIDLVAEAEKHNIRAEHAEIVARSLIQQEDWESEPHQKAAKTRAKNAAAEAEDTDPAAPDEETA